MPGYGFEKGSVAFIAHDHDEMKEQRGVQKSEGWWESLVKSTPAGLKHFYENRDQYLANGEGMNHGENHGDWLMHVLENGNLPHDPDLDSEDENIRDRAERTREDQAEEELKKAPISINFPAKRLGQLMQSGRFKNIFETGHSGGSGMDEEDPDYNSDRIQAEANVLGIPEDAPAEERPVYGAVNKRWLHALNNVGGAKGYGDAFVTLKPHVHDRTTFTGRDSFDDDNNPPVTAEHLPKLFSHHGEPGSRDYGYIEAQIHGGVDLGKDVQSLHVGPNTHPILHQDAINFGKMYKIPVFHHPDGMMHRKLYDPIEEAQKAAAPAPQLQLALSPAKPSPKKKAAARTRTSPKPKPGTKIP
jgi:hypothetical protein